MPVLAACVAALVLAACGGGSTTAQPVEPDYVSLGDPQGGPTLATLPSLARGASGQTPRTRQGILAAREGFDLRLPASPMDRTHATLQKWVDDDVVSWIRGRSRNLDTARYEFGLEGGATDGERIVANAVIGLLHEDTARELATIPVPAELDSEPEIAEIYREVVRAHARPFLSSALVGYRECANVAHDGPEDMRHWAGYCDGRFQRIKRQLDDYQRSISGQPSAAEPAADPAAGGTGKTSVTVIVEPQ